MREVLVSLRTNLLPPPHQAAFAMTRLAAGELGCRHTRCRGKHRVLSSVVEACGNEGLITDTGRRGCEEQRLELPFPPPSGTRLGGTPCPIPDMCSAWPRRGWTDVAEHPDQGSGIQCPPESLAKPLFQRPGGTFVKSISRRRVRSEVSPQPSKKYDKIAEYPTSAWLSPAPQHPPYSILLSRT